MRRRILKSSYIHPISKFSYYSPYTGRVSYMVNGKWNIINGSSGTVEINSFIRSFCMASTNGYSTSSTELDMRDMDVSRIGSLHQCFFNMDTVRVIDVSTWDTRNVQSMSEMFSGCTKLTDIDISSFSFRLVMDISSMFYNCNQLVSFVGLEKIGSAPTINKISAAVNESNLSGVEIITE